jgi:hypothetical protein
MLESLFHCFPEVLCRGVPDMHVYFDFLPQGRSIVIRIQGRVIGYVPPVLFDLPIETEREISAVKNLMVGDGVPLLMTELDKIHLMIL